MKSKLAEKIRQARLLKNLSQQNIADELNLTLAGYSKIERGVTELTVTRLEQIVAVLDMKIEDFLLENLQDVSEPAIDYKSEIHLEIIKILNRINSMQAEINQLQGEVSQLKGR